MISILVAITILALQVRTGLISPSQVEANVYAVLWPYLVLIGIFVGFHVLRAPWQLDKENQQEINILSGQVAIKLARDAVVRMTALGHGIQRRAPKYGATPVEIEAWDASRRDWLAQTGEYLKERSNADYVIFVDNSNMQAVEFEGVHHDAQKSMLILSVRLRNLLGILERQC